MDVEWHEYTDVNGENVPVINASITEKASIIGRVGIMFLSCGTGACAVFAAALSLGLAGSRARIIQPGGTLVTSSFGSDITLDGDARHVYDGEYISIHF